MSTSEVEEPLLPQSHSHSHSPSPSRSTSHSHSSPHPINRSSTLSLSYLLPFIFSPRQYNYSPNSTPPGQRHKLKARQSWRNRRTSKSLIVCLIVLITLVFVYFRYLHRFVFIDYSSFTAPTRLAIIHPGTDPESSVPPFRLDRLPLTTNITHDTPHHLRYHLLIDRALQEISQRFQSVYIQPSTLSCKPSNETQNLINTRFLDRNARPNGRHKVMIALNLHSSQEVLPAITTAILNALRYIGIENLFVSIYENGSWDHTPEGMGHLGAVLTGLGVGHRLRSAKEETSWAGADRIKILSEYRNMALSAIHEAELHMNGLTELVFINDVFLCAQDILETIWERNFQIADVSCGTDWKESEKISDRLGWNKKRKEEENMKNKLDLNKSVVFYDSWVARSLTGNTLRPRLDLLGDYRDGYSVIFDREPSKVYRARFQNTLPVPVYSCWNGIVALNPKPFKSPFNLTFRSADRANGECPSSECQLLAKDFWSLGFHKWILVPKVAVTYAQDMYYSNPIVLGSNRDHRIRQLPSSSDHLKHDQNLGFFDTFINNHHFNQDEEFSNEKINWNKYSKPETVVCWPDMHDFHLDFEWNHVLESPYNSKLFNSSIFNEKSLSL